MKKITWLGHAAFKIEAGDATIFVDPWIEKNPTSPIKSFKEIEKADIVLVTHDHVDHGFEDAVKICKKTRATFVGVFELANIVVKKGATNYAAGNIGGEIEVNGIKIYFAQAVHSCEIGAPCGFVVKTRDLTFYHTGDTAFYSDMEYLEKLYTIDVMMLPICSKYMMGIKEASWAVEKIKPGIAIPCHYDALPALKQDPMEFKNLVGSSAKVVILESGKFIEL